jgi:hypothetical protein
VHDAAAAGEQEYPATERRHYGAAAYAISEGGQLTRARPFVNPASGSMMDNATEL